MAGSVNKAILVGNLGKDPEIRSTQAGNKCANLRIATSESWRDKQTGERQERTEWHNVVIWGPLADVAEKYLRKGSKVYVSGQIRTRKWQDQSGADRYSTEIVLQGFQAELVMLSGKEEGGGSGGSSGRSSGGNDYADRSRGEGGGQAAPTYADDLDDEIPF